MEFSRQNHKRPSRLEVYLLGQVPVSDALCLQRRFLYEASNPWDPMGVLLLCEHLPGLTVGRGGSRAHIAWDDEQLRRAGLRIWWVSRGSGCWLHVPGQLVSYLILPMVPWGLAGYRQALLEVLARILDEFAVRSYEFDRRYHWIRTPLGVVGGWGIGIHDGVSSFGFWLNCSLRTDLFRILELEPGKPMRATTLEALRQRPTLMSRLREATARHVSDVFGVGKVLLFSGDHLLRPSFRHHAAVTSLGF
jgi:lipoyl(octanoyl) transferase